MNLSVKKSRFGWPWRVIVGLAVLLLPLAPGESVGILAADEGKTEAAAAKEADTEYPQIVKSSPKRGETGVDPTLTEISVTFDRDMSKGMSWTGGPPDFPSSPADQKARWIDNRTCGLPVKLEKGAYYRVGINSTSHQNFRSASGVPALPSAICFTTTGATAALEDRVDTPKVVSLIPKNGATDVDAKTTKSLKVTFDMPMGEGMSWTGSGPSVPRATEGRKATWSSDKKTCTLPVTLEQDHEYEIGLNSPEHVNFQSKWGVPLEPVVYKFKTKGK